MSETGGDVLGDKKIIDYMDAVRKTRSSDVDEKMDGMEEIQTMLAELSAEDLVALDDFLGKLGDDSEYSEEVRKWADMHKKLGFNRRSSEYVEGLVVKAGLSDKVYFHRLGRSCRGEEEVVHITIDWHVKREDFDSFLNYAAGVDGVKVEQDSEGNPCLIFPVKNLFTKREEAGGDEAVSITEDVGAEIKGV